MRKFVAILLSTTLIIPYIIGLTHCIHEDHFHNDKEVQFQELEVDCLTCDYLRVGFDYKSNNQYILTDQFTDEGTIENLYKVIFSAKIINNLGSRGPPSDC